MGWDPVPWMISGGAEHSTNVARNVAYAAFGGGEGVVDTGSCEVRALDVPGSSVQVSPGTVAIKNRSTGAMDELYVAQHTAVETVAIAPTAGAARSDLIVARVEDPNTDGSSWGAPADPAVGPYIFTRVIAGVPSTTTTAAELGLDHSMIALARIDIPSGTGTITQAMVHDLRALAQARKERAFSVFSGIVTTETLSSTNVQTDFPSVAHATVTVPSWATHVRGLCQTAGLAVAEGTQASGWVNIVISVPGQSDLVFPSTVWATDATVLPEAANTLGGGQDIVIPPAFRGKSATIKITHTRTSGTDVLTFWAGSTALIDVEFYQKPIDYASSPG